MQTFTDKQVRAMVKKLRGDKTLTAEEKETLIEMIEFVAQYPNFKTAASCARLGLLLS